MPLRYYQQEAIDAAYKHLRANDDNPCIVIPTGGGKTHVMATICHDAVERWGGRVLILAHVKELLLQTTETIMGLSPGLNVGVYSAGLDSRNTTNDVIVAGIQSVYRRPEQLGRFDLVLVDECHLIPLSGEGMYRTFLEASKKITPHQRVIGLTATPYRTSTGMVCGPDHFLNEICYEVGVKQMIHDGYLCDLKSKAAVNKADTSDLHLRNGEFKSDETQALMGGDDTVAIACEEIVEATKDLNSVLIFCAGVEHCQQVAMEMELKRDQRCEFVTGTTSKANRAETIEAFKRGEFKYLANINVLTTGFDAPNVDCIVLLRPTMSPGLYYQMVGRGFRLYPDKDYCLVLDFGDNIIRHGPVDMLQAIDERPAHPGECPGKECPTCHSVIAAGYRTCPCCGHEFPEPERKRHGHTAASEDILSGEATIERHEVQDIYCCVHEKRGAPEGHPKTLRVEYIWDTFGEDVIKEYVCFEHEGYARRKAVDWWQARSKAPMPDTAAEALKIIDAGGVCETHAITVKTRPGQKFPEFSCYELGPIPAWREPGWEDEGEVSSETSELIDADIPF